MKKYEKRMSEPVEHTYLVEVTCDLCGTAGKTEDRWSGSHYDVDETEISVVVKQKEGFSCPDGGSGTEFDIDICPTCFKEKLVPFLQDQGANIQPKEWDW